MKKIIYLGLAAIFFTFSQVATVHAVKVGTAVPDFTLQDSQGKQQKLSSFRDKFVVLEWFNDGCPYVKKHYNSKNMQGLQKKYTDKGVVWLTILSSASGKQGHRSTGEINKIMKDHGGASSAVLLDPDGKVAQLYGAKTTPHMYIINPQGELIYMGAIDSKASADPADIPSATNYVQSTLDQAMAGKAVSPAATVPYGCSVKY